MSCFMLTIPVMVTEGHLHSHKYILVKRVPENVPEIPISFIFHKYCLNHGLIRCLSNWTEWVNLSRCDFDQCELNQNIFYFNLELSRYDTNLQEFRDQIFNFRIIFPLSILKMLLPLRFSTRFSL